MTSFDLLFVCTGNICRSPMAELLAVSELRHALGPQAGRIQVHSAGTYGLEGWPIEPHAGRTMATYGVPAAAFRARRITAELVRPADLVLTATREHRADVVRLVPAASARTFTMREFARLTESVDPDELPTGDLVDRAHALVAAAAARRGTVEGTDVDVADPYGLPAQVYERCAAQIADALRLPIALLTGRAR
jgi:protein-tyrosine phosphatase